ncbi:MAG TPA: sugar transferase [Terriglobales bacterium]|nr:sugar transferase [Terriglobales bacterium]
MKKHKLQYWILGADELWTILAMALAFVLRFGLTWQDSIGNSAVIYLPPLLGSLALWAVLFSPMQLDGFSKGWHPSAILSQLFLAICFLMMALFAGGYIARIFMSRLVFAYFGILLFTGFVSIRYIVRAVLGSKYLIKAVRRVLIVGNGPVAREIAAKIDRHPELLCQVIGFLCSADTSASDVPRAMNGSAIIQTLGVVDLLQEQKVDEVIIALSKPGTPEVMNLAQSCRQAGIGVSVVPHPYELYLSKPQLLDIGGLPILQLRQVDLDPVHAVWKRGLDIALGSFLLVLSAPFIIFGAVMLSQKEGGPFCREPRCGRAGNLFRMWRLNSDRDAQQLPSSEIILQQLSITELPQLWNVLLGDMSLVGPRPESPERVKHYSDWQRQRLNVKPGMTGLAQVHGLRQQHSSEEKARFDLQYMLRPSPFQDVVLLLQTMWTLTGRLLHLRTLAPGKRMPSHNNDPDKLFERNLPSAHSAQPSAD